MHNRQLLCVRLQDPLSQELYTFPPGGLIEEGETPEDASKRETLEETGYSVEIETKSEVTGMYPFTWNGTLFDCTTHFFRARLITGNGKGKGKPLPVKDASYHRGVLWVPDHKMDEHLSFHPLLYSFIKQLL